MWRRTDVLEARRPRLAQRRCGWDLDALSDDDLEALMPLSAKQAAADDAGRKPTWTPDELVQLEQLAAKAGALP